MSEWSQIRLDELGAPTKSAFATGPFGSAVSSREFRTEGFPMIRGGNLSEDPGTRLDESDLVFVSDKLAAQFARSVVRRGDLIFTCWGTVGQVGLLDSRSQFPEYLVSNKQMKMTPNPDRVDSVFLYYYLSSTRIQSLIRGMSIGSTIPGLNLGQLKSLPVRIPSLHTQRGIAEVLGTLDDKIAANTRILDVADEFVRANYSALKLEAREGRRLGALATNVRAKAAPGSVAPDSMYVGLEHVPRRHLWLVDHGRAGSVTSDKWHFEPGDVLFGKLRPYFHKVVTAAAPGICSTDILVVRATDPAISGLVLAAAADDDTIQATTAATEGTRMPRTSWKDLAVIEVPWPAEVRCREFSSKVTVVARLSNSTVNENSHLTAARDALLPLLMSGKVTVKDAESVVGEVL